MMFRESQVHGRCRAGFLVIFTPFTDANPPTQEAKGRRLLLCMGLGYSVEGGDNTVESWSQASSSRLEQMFIRREMEKI